MSDAQFFFEIVRRDYYIACHSQAFFMIRCLEKSQHLFNSQFAIMVEPSENYKPANAFHMQVCRIIRLVTSLNPDWASCPAFISKRKAHFCPDGTHLSERGEKRLFFMMRNFLEIIANNLNHDVFNLHDTIDEVTQMIHDLDNTPAARSLPRNFGQYVRIQDTFEETHYIRQTSGSGKKMAKYSSNGKLRINAASGGNFASSPAQRGHLCVTH